MTKSEYLKSIGYKVEWFEGESFPGVLYKMYKGSDGIKRMRMYIICDENKYYVSQSNCGIITNQRQIDDLQIAFNNVKRDFEEMQKYD